MSFQYCPNCGSHRVMPTVRTYGKGEEKYCVSCCLIHHVCEEIPANIKDLIEDEEPTND